MSKAQRYILQWDEQGESCCFMFENWRTYHLLLWGFAARDHEWGLA